MAGGVGRPAGWGRVVGLYWGTPGHRKSAAGTP